MKKIIGVLFFALALLAAQAQYTLTQWSSTNYWGDNTTISAQTGLGCGLPLSFGKFNQVGIQISFNLDGAGTADHTFNFATSLDGTNYCSIPDVVIKLKATGVTSACTNASVTLGPRAYLRLTSIVTGSNGGAVTTNGLIYIATKAGRRD